MQGLPVLAKILSTRHEATHVFKHCIGTLRHLVPCPLQTGNWGCAQSRDDRGQGGKVIQTSAFLIKGQPSVNKQRSNQA